MKTFDDQEPRPHSLTKLAERIARHDLRECRVVTGFDGFVDEMITLVGERRSLDDFSAVPDIATFASMLAASAGHSSLREIVVNDVHPGGCAVNVADGLASLGVRVDCFATAGDPVHPAFALIAGKCHGFHSWGSEPGRTLAFEFNDGKLMFSAGSQLAAFTVEAVRARLADGVFFQACESAQVIALTDWTMYPHMTAVWKMLQTEVFSRLDHRPHFFIDLVDPSSRSPQDILAMAAMLRDFEANGSLTLGLNGNEANILCRLHGLTEFDAAASMSDIADQASTLRETLRISRVVIHRARFAVSATRGETSMQAVPYCDKPRKNTGAGDRFNAGYCLGLALGADAEESLALACCAAGFFVRCGHSADKPQLLDFLQSWNEDMVD